MNDIVARLRGPHGDACSYDHIEAADEITRLRAELAAEWERAESWKTGAWQAITERDALRALLREARDRLIDEGVLYSEPLVARIDAALKGDE